MLTAQNLRQKYLEFFKEKGHAIIPSAPLVPEKDPGKPLQKELLTLLFGILTEISLF